MTRSDTLATKRAMDYFRGNVICRTHRELATVAGVVVAPRHNLDLVLVDVTTPTVQRSVTRCSPDGILSRRPEYGTKAAIGASPIVRDSMLSTTSPGRNSSRR